MTKDELMDKFCSVFNEATTANDAEDIKISLLAFKKAFTVLADVNPRMAKEVLECYEGTLKYYNFLTENEAEEIVAAFQNGVTPMSCLKRLSNMMVGLNVNLTTTNGHCMLQ